ncbi:MAG TPA: hypothetical protein VN719_11825 [Gemmatimonadales bacterium]|nr:hypothetical protein [Gemmatimonadales bacterium]
MAGVEMGVALGHLQVGPAAEFLKHSQRRTGLGLPACPRVPHAVEGDLLQSDGFALSPPHRGGELPDRRAAAVNEDVPVDFGRPLVACLLVFCLPSLEYRDSVVVERHGDGLAALGQVAGHEATAAIQVDTLPFESGDIGFPQAGRQGEDDHVARVFRKPGEKQASLFTRDPFGLDLVQLEPRDVWRRRDHLPPIAARAAAKDGAGDCEYAIAGRFLPCPLRLPPITFAGPHFQQGTNLQQAVIIDFGQWVIRSDVFVQDIQRALRAVP